MSTTFTGGWYCSGCGQFITSGTLHSCSGTTTYMSYPYNPFVALNSFWLCKNCGQFNSCYNPDDCSYCHTSRKHWKAKEKEA